MNDAGSSWCRSLFANSTILSRRELLETTVVKELPSRQSRRLRDQGAALSGL